MDVYRRYFRITEGPVVELATENIKVNEEARKQYKALLKEVGAKTEEFLVSGNDSVTLVGMFFDKCPDMAKFKKVKGHHNSWYPKKNSKVNKALCKRFEDVEARGDRNLLQLVGLENNFFRILANGKSYRETVVVLPSLPPVVYVCVPWFDADPKDIEAARNSDKKGKLEALLWEPAAEMVEIKSWELDKAIEEWNTDLKKKPLTTKQAEEKFGKPDTEDGTCSLNCSLCTKRIWFQGDLQDAPREFTCPYCDRAIQNNHHKS